MVFGAVGTIFLPVPNLVVEVSKTEAEDVMIQVLVEQEKIARVKTTKWNNATQCSVQVIIYFLHLGR